MITKKSKKFNLFLNGIVLLVIILFTAIIPADYVSSNLVSSNLIVISISILFILNSYSWYCSGYKLETLLPIILIVIIWALYLWQVLTTCPAGYGLFAIFIVGGFGTCIYLINIFVYLIMKPKS